MNWIFRNDIVIIASTLPAIVGAGVSNTGLVHIQPEQITTAIVFATLMGAAMYWLEFEREWNQ